MFQQWPPKPPELAHEDWRRRGPTWLTVAPAPSLIPRLSVSSFYHCSLIPRLTPPLTIAVPFPCSHVPGFCGLQYYSWKWDKASRTYAPSPLYQPSFWEHWWCRWQLFCYYSCNMHFTFPSSLILRLEPGYEANPLPSPFQFFLCRCGIALDTWMLPIHRNMYETGIQQPLLFINSHDFQWVENVQQMMKLSKPPDDSGISSCQVLTLK